MKTRRIAFFAALLAGVASVLLFANGIDAQTYTWDPLHNGGAGGPGDWDFTSGNWASSGSSSLTWTDSSDAAFGSLNGTAGTVTVTSQVTPNSITFNPAGSGNYVISGGPINLPNTATAITLNTDATISSPLVGSGGLSVAGPGTLTLSGSNTYGGPTLVSGGTLNIAGGGSLNNTSSINTQGGGLLSINSGMARMATGSTSFAIGCGLDGTTGTTTVNNGGVLTIGGSNGCTFVGGGFVPNGPCGTGTFNISGGLVNVGAAGGSGPGGTDTSHIWLNAYGGSGSTINLNGGTLSTARPIANGTYQSLGYVNFNGGVLQAAADIPDILHDLDGNYKLTVYVQHGGATIDTNGHDTAIDPSLLDGGGGGGLTKIGAGTLVLAAASSYSGPTIVNGGALIFSGSNIYSGPTTVNGGTLQMNVSGDDNVVGTLGGDGSITVNNGGALIAGATDALGVNFPAAASKIVNINQGGTLSLVPNVLGGSIHLSMVRTVNCVGGTLASQDAGDTISTYLFADVFGAAYNFTSGTDGRASTISAPNVALGLLKNGSTTFNVTAGSGAVDLNVTGTLIDNGYDYTSGALIKAGNGVMVLSGFNSYTGGTTINGGTLAVSGLGTLGATSGSLALGGGVLDLGGGSQIVSAVSITAGGNTIQNGTLTVTSYGGITVNGGTLQLGTGVTGQDGSINSTSGAANNGALVYSICGSQTAAYAISGSGSLTKLGGGTLILSASNIYSGPTTVNGGTLQLNVSGDPAVGGDPNGGGSLAGNGPITVNNRGALLAGATDALGADYPTAANKVVNINQGGTLSLVPNVHLSMVRTINCVGGTLASQDSGDSVSTYLFWDGFGSSYNFTSGSDGRASTISAVNVALGVAGTGNATFNVTAGSGAVDLNVTGTLINNGYDHTPVRSSRRATA